jgi:hypothetical protein
VTAHILSSEKEMETNMLARKSAMAVSLILVAGLLISGCSNSSDDNVTNVTSDASVEFVHASSQTPPVDILIDGTPRESNLLYPNHTVYSDITPGSRNIIVRLSGTSAPDYIDTNITFADNLIYSIFLTDTLPHLKLVVMPDVLDKPVGDSVHVRFINLAPDKGSVDVYTLPGDSIFAGMTNVEYNHYTNPVQLDMGTYSLQIRGHGTGDTLTTSNPVFDFTSGSNYTLMLIVPPGPGSGVMVDTVVTK